MKIEKNFTNKELFYQSSIRLLSSMLPAEKQITPTEETVLLFILTKMKPLEGELRKELCDKIKCSSQSLSAHLKRLKIKGWLDDNGLLEKHIDAMQTEVNKGTYEVKVSLWYGGNS